MTIPDNAITADQLAAARGKLRMGLRAFAKAADIGLSTVQKIEGGGECTWTVYDKIRTFLRGHGVVLVGDHQDPFEGVQWTKE